MRSVTAAMTASGFDAGERAMMSIATWSRTVWIGTSMDAA